MKILDPDNLVSDFRIIERVVKSHPFSSNLYHQIKTLVVRLHPKAPEEGPTISFNHDTHEAILNIVLEMDNCNHYEYILYHEFGHIADRLNPKFRYSDESRLALSKTEQVMFMELWNLYIDARLNHFGHFKLTKIAMGGYCRIDGKLQRAPFSIEGKLLRHISCLRSGNIDNADQIVRSIWENPLLPRSYDDLINLIRKKE